MNDQAYQTLYAMLLGEPSYERHGAPEPGLLFKLMPVLPEGVLAEAVWGVAGVEISWLAQRQRLLAALLERAAEAGQADLLAQAIVQFPEVIPHLAESILPQALDAVRAFEWWDKPARAAALALLAARVPTPSLEAARVIGTEITIYEPLAVAFGEACLKRFMDGTSIGEAVRQARLELLQQGNPLGLVYDAFAIASLKMVPAS